MSNCCKRIWEEKKYKKEQILYLIKVNKYEKNGILIEKKIFMKIWIQAQAELKLYYFKKQNIQDMKMLLFFISKQKQLNIKFSQVAQFFRLKKNSKA